MQGRADIGGQQRPLPETRAIRVKEKQGDKEGRLSRRMSDSSREGIGFISGLKIGIKTHLRNTPILGKELTRLFLAYQLHSLYNVSVAGS